MILKFRIINQFLSEEKIYKTNILFIFMTDLIKKYVYLSMNVSYKIKEMSASFNLTKNFYAIYIQQPIACISSAKNFPIICMGLNF